MKLSVTSWPLAQMKKSGRSVIELVGLGMVDTTVPKPRLTSKSTST